MRIVGVVKIDMSGSLGALVSSDEQPEHLALYVFCPTNLAPNKEFVLLSGRTVIEEFLQKTAWVSPVKLADTLALPVLTYDESAKRVYLTTKEMPHELRRLPHRMISASEIPRHATLTEWAKAFVHFAHVSTRAEMRGETVQIGCHSMLLLPVSPTHDLIAEIELYGFNAKLREILVVGAASMPPEEAQKQLTQLRAVRGQKYPKRLKIRSID